MQTSSHVEIDNWDDLEFGCKKIINIRPKGTYKPQPKPTIPTHCYKPCCDPMNNQRCPIDQQPLPCNICPINEKEPNTNCNNCCQTTDSSTLYGSENIVEEKPVKKTRKTTATKTKTTRKKKD